MSAAVVLFTRDLRVHDQEALASAAREHAQVLPVFVLDRELLAGSCASPNRLAFLLESLRDLDRSLRERGARLMVRWGDPVREALNAAHACDAQGIYMSADVTPYARARQRRLAAACERERVALRVFPGITVLAPGEATPQGGDHYRIFTPYWRVWNARARPPGARLGRLATPTRMRWGAVPELAELTRGQRSPWLPAGGEGEGRRLLRRWLRGGLGRYDDLRDDLAAAATSRLSAHLHFGCLSPRTVLERTSSQPSGEGFARQLCWRDFHHQVLAARPDLPSSDYRPRGDRWREDEHATAAWRVGLTGYPIVDAGMRQLAQEGYVHNRARMVVASFLCKTLYIDWRLGARHFARLLVDADIACNVGNWQWVAGTGNDTRPNRVLNPLRQAVRFDPTGEYVRRYVPELDGVAGAAVHQPWLLSPAARRRLSYPQPLVEPHAGGHPAAARLGRARYGSSSPS